MTDKTTLNLDEIETLADKTLVSYSRDAAILIKHNIPAIIAEVRDLLDANDLLRSTAKEALNVIEEIAGYEWLARTLKVVTSDSPMSGAELRRKSTHAWCEAMVKAAYEDVAIALEIRANEIEDGDMDAGEVREWLLASVAAIRSRATEQGE